MNKLLLHSLMAIGLLSPCPLTKAMEPAPQVIDKSVIDGLIARIWMRDPRDQEKAHQAFSIIQQLLGLTQDDTVINGKRLICPCISARALMHRELGLHGASVAIRDRALESRYEPAFRLFNVLYANGHRPDFNVALNAALDMATINNPKIQSLALGALKNFLDLEMIFTLTVEDRARIVSAMPQTTHIDPGTHSFVISILQLLIYDSIRQGTALSAHERSQILSAIMVQKINDVDVQAAALNLLNMLIPFTTPEERRKIASFVSALIPNKAAWVERSALSTLEILERAERADFQQPSSSSIED